MNLKVPAQFPDFILLDEKHMSQLLEYFRSMIIKQFPGMPWVDDLVQETVIRIWSKQHLYNPAKSSFITWSSRICIYLCIDQLRQLKSKPVLEFEENVAKGNAHIASDQIGLAALVNGLQEDERKVIDLAYYQGFTHQEIANYFQIPLGTVKSRVMRGIKNLRIYFADTPISN